MHPERRGRGFRLQGTLLAVALVGALVGLVAREIYQTDAWRRSFFAGATSLGEACTVAVAGGPAAPERAELQQRPASPVSVPHADDVLLARVAADAAYVGALYRCTIPRTAVAGGVAYAHLGWVFADRTEVSVDGHVVATFTGNDKPAIALPADALGARDLSLEVLATGKRRARFGLVGFQPAVLATGSALNARIFGVEAALQALGSLFALLPMLTLASVLAFGWLYGLRTRLMVTAFWFFLFATLRAGLPLLSDELPWGLEFTYALRGPFTVATGAAFLLVGVELFRLSPRWAGRALGATVLGTGVYLAAVVLASDAQAFWQPVLSGARIATGVAALALVARTWRDVRPGLASSPRLWLLRTYHASVWLFALATATDAVCDALHYYFRIAHHAYVLMPLCVGGALLFNLFLIREDYHAERLRSADLKEKLRLGKVVQDLLVPEELCGTGAGARYRLFYEPAGDLSGDWLHVWPTGDGEHRLLMGDVTGKGPQAALAVAAIKTTLIQAQRSKLRLPEAITLINDTLLELFRGRVQSTLAAVALQPDGRAEVFTAGGAVWLKGTPGNLAPLARRSSLLGNDPEISIGRALCTLAEGEILVSFSDGVCDGGAAFRRFAEIVAGSPEVTRSAEELYRAACSAGGADVFEDDKTMVVVHG